MGSSVDCTIKEKSVNFKMNQWEYLKLKCKEREREKKRNEQNRIFKNKRTISKLKHTCNKKKSEWNKRII